MKKLLVAVTLLTTMGTANADWYAEAHSSSNMGTGEHASRNLAVLLAVNGCLVRSTYGDVCEPGITYWVDAVEPTPEPVPEPAPECHWWLALWGRC